MKKVVLIIQARMGSTRLPGKSMLDLSGKPLIHRVLERVLKVKNADEVVLAIPDTPDNNILESQAKKFGISVYKGSENDLLDRYFKAANIHNADIVGRIPADNPLSEPEEIDKIILHHKHLNSPGFSSNLAEVFQSGYPDGIGAEMFDFSLLESAWKNEKNKLKREHVHLNFYDYQSDKPVDKNFCPVSTIKCPIDIQRPDLVLDVNTPEQLSFIQDIYKYFSNSDRFFGIRDIINWYDNIYAKGK